jgi:hypothetical protein
LVPNINLASCILFLPLHQVNEFACALVLIAIHRLFLLPLPFLNPEP